MIKSAQCVTRLYQGKQTLPNSQYHEFGSTAIEIKKTYSRKQSSGFEQSSNREQNWPECKEPA